MSSRSQQPLSAATAATTIATALPTTGLTRGLIAQWVRVHAQEAARKSALELTPFRGHFIFWEGGVHDVETKKCISAGVPATDGRVGPVGPQPGRAVAGV